MSFKDVMVLRKSGQLKEALEMAEQDYANSPEDVFTKRSVAWVYYDFLKRYAMPENYPYFINYLEKLKELLLSNDEKMIFDNCAFQIGKLVFALSKDEEIDQIKIDEIFNHIQDFHFSKPSEAYSFLYKSFHKGYQGVRSYFNFTEWWGFENFRSEDFKAEVYNDRKIMPLAEQAYITYAKKIFEGTPIGGLGVAVGGFDSKRAEEFIPVLGDVVEKYPDMQYPPYYHAKLLLATGQKNKALSSLIPFAKRKPNEFWVWDMMSGAFEKGDPKQMSCLCKALSVGAKDEFLINTRQKLAELFIEKGDYQRAKAEIKHVIATRKLKKWSVPGIVNEWKEQSWYKEVKKANDNDLFYNQHLSVAEEILFEDITEEIIVVEFVNTNKKVLSFVRDEHKQGFFRYSNLIENPKIGDIYMVRFIQSGNEGFAKVLTLRKAPDNTLTPALKTFNGNIRIIEPSNIGFVDDVFFDSKIIKQNVLGHDQEIQGKAILSFNKKKKVWGWKAASIQ